MRPVGRIRRGDDSVDSAAVWEWAIDVSHFSIPPWGSGRASSLDEAKSSFLEAWVRFYNELGPTFDEHWQRKARGEQDPGINSETVNESERALLRRLIGDAE